MRLPYHDKCVVSQRKIVEYLLSDKHPVGRSKARIFRKLGYSPEDWNRCATDLKAVAERNEVTKKEESPFGTRYVIDGNLKTAEGRDFPVRTVWFIDNESQIPHFITAYPKKG